MSQLTISKRPNAYDPLGIAIRHIAGQHAADVIVANIHDELGILYSATGSTPFEALVKLMMRPEARNGFDVSLEL